MEENKTQTKIIVFLKNGDNVNINSPESLEELIKFMTKGIDDFLGFKDISGSFLLIKMSEINVLKFVPTKAEDATS